MNVETIRRGEIIIEKLRRSMTKAGVDAIVAMVPENFYYASGCPVIFQYLNRVAGLAMVIVPRDSSLAPTAILNPYELPTFIEASWIEDVRTYTMWLYIDETYRTDKDVSSNRAKEDKKGTDFGVAEGFRILSDALKEKGLSDKVIGIETSFMQHNSWQMLLQNCPDAKIVDSENIWIDSRIIKTPWEIDYIRTATEVTERAIAKACESVVEGASYSDVLHAYNVEVARDPRVLGPHFCHLRMGKNWSPSFLLIDYHLKSGDIVEFDCGVLCQGYLSDMARTFVLGKPNNIQKRTHDLVTTGLKEALKLVEPGRRFCEVFEAGHGYVKRQMPHFSRGHIGHSLGLSVTIEEPPFISPTDERRFEPGMVFCVEIPYYGYEVGAISNEQIVVITENGYELLTKSPLDLIEL